MSVDFTNLIPALSLGLIMVYALVLSQDESFIHDMSTDKWFILVSVVFLGAVCSFIPVVNLLSICLLGSLIHDKLHIERW